MVALESRLENLSPMPPFTTWSGSSPFIYAGETPLAYGQVREASDGYHWLVLGHDGETRMWTCLRLDASFTQGHIYGFESKWIASWPVVEQL